MNKLWYLSQISLFDALPMEDLMEIDKMSPMVKLKKGELIQTPDTFREGLYMLKEGKLKLYKINAEGKQFIVSILGAGNVFGEVDSFSLGTRDTFIETMENTILCSLDKDQFERFLIERPHLAVKLMKELSALLKDRDAMLAQLALGDVREKILHLLVALAGKFGIAEENFHKIDIPLSHQEIGNMIGSTRETVTVALNELAKEHVIKTGRMSIHVDLERAKNLLQY
ncbi:Crp/Fnr family transcriptional regulator [Paenibacillus filicis]|uniref:Crp/Fnr family transcriptional regulator n=1 Tax=Paenibacillus gyeongsangnamensis TaxID=3388067 RepID=A0ABT4QJ95_9BACL|nr:Crp/Fnr family transcriptional regulator [Paenibacillus filicis]MCZ8516954.1 Crp/Fnr family transcriptional regulator [Paenibacillus filicis]